MDSGVLHDFIAGWVGGCAGIIVGHPFDTTKVQMQTHLGRKAFTSTWDAVKNIRTHGMAHGFFRGMALPLASYGLINSVFFGVYGNTYKLLTGRSTTNGNADRRHYWTVFLSGCVGGAAQLVVACPTEVVKVILQSQIDPKSAAASSSHFFHGAPDCLRDIYSTGGIRALYRGASAFALRDIPSFGLYMVTYELVERKISSLSFTDDQGLASSLLAGGTAGVLSWSLIIPLDVVKSRLQADPYGLKYGGMVDCAVSSYRQEGWRVFFTGLGVSCMRAFPVNAVTFLIYSRLLAYLNKNW